MPSSIIGVIQQFLQPPINTMDGEAIPGNPQTGTHSFTRPLGPIPVAAYGIAWEVDSIPAGIGSSFEAGEVVYDRSILWIKSTFVMTLTGLLLPYNLIETNQASGLYLFAGGFPASAEVTIYPGVAINLWWLVLA